MIRILSHVEFEVVEEDDSSDDDMGGAKKHLAYHMEANILAPGTQLRFGHPFEFSGGSYAFYFNAHKWRVH